MTKMDDNYNFHWSFDEIYKCQKLERKNEISFFNILSNDEYRNLQIEEQMFVFRDILLFRKGQNINPGSYKKLSLRFPALTPGADT